MTEKNYSIEALELGPAENFIYLIHDHKTNRAAVVDPAWDVPKVIELAKQKGVEITDILLTHSHHDHINGIGDVLDKYDAQVHLLKQEADFWGDHPASPSIHYGGDEIMLGDSSIKVLHTPGHTPGSACYQIGDDLLTGDTMFVFGCGRCDFTGGDPEVMYKTLNKIRTELPSSTTILPGHNYAVKKTSTIAEQIKGNPFLHQHSLQDFVQYRMNTPKRKSPYEAEPESGCGHDH
ncbi:MULTISPECIES: MBL fold metallo-hydrolase [Cycloclasticus]|jgi:glyoxylase-like metal-dependent hydrolase (beta-lactamase superfamily II)|uniref:Metallo-beta-lactamase family protein n=1 Tax=Cycloclasticus pugetii TaxID=34068 RepID=A0AB33Z2P5_9GAMM|nr:MULTISPECIES: MBL fold metallo-hydrolase [Cycloclasticus]AFT66261.1 Metallo-beta-lactamase family protein [Cycloclasticus sp. P1]ATI01949.1 MBL fold metallo-hydrolase [Cycloclasticus sp. PY97N]EPD13313.1 metallo-beta-lactamase family protein [Cycloclasticus pugetii]MBV1898441.1 MBL fold metallo-hydrolase [Cycloclasticus sp.]SHJ16816.1 Glyoxylase, beta-lactamase superfamily II [Cycloclasticus pugetii]